MHNFIIILETVFKQAGDKTRAAQQAAYLKHRFEFFGITRPAQTALEKPILAQHKITSLEQLKELILLLWQKPQREYHYTALRLAYKYHKLWDISCLDFFKHLLTTNAWWDSVDFIAPHLIGKLLAKYPEQQHIMDTWITDQSMWIRRAALLFQLKYKHTTDTGRLFAYCQQTMHEKEFFIRKAIGWALRELSKTDPQVVNNFVLGHKAQLNALSLREASRLLPKQARFE